MSAYPVARAEPAPAARPSVAGSSSSARTEAKLSEARIGEAQEAFARGRAALDAGLPSEALVEFRHAAEIKSTPGLHYFVAHCLEQLDRLLEAEREYAEAERLLLDLPARDVRDLLPEARARLGEVTPRLNVEASPASARVFVDDQKKDQGVGLSFDPGTHTVRVEADGYESKVMELNLVRSERRTLRVDLTPKRAPSGAETTQSETRESESSSARPVLFWSAVGVAVVGAGVGITGAILHANADSDVARYGAEVDEASGGSSSACAADNPPAACVSLEDALDQRSWTATMQWVGLATALGGAVAATTVYFAWPNEPSDAGVGARVGLYFEGQLGGGRMGLRGRF
ncbi:MAG TPA: PEGA domain-containing protein [Polyangiaceae bacterium]|nr:PEGA domain-containing protein [Polyangiaceae bacterium]